MKAAALMITAVVGAIVATIAGVVAWEVGRTAGTNGHVTVAAASAPVATGHLYLTIETPDMLGTQVGPAYVPADPTVPANADVTVTIVNFDDATALTGAAAQWATATGIEGKITVQKLDPTNPNAAPTTPPQQFSSLDPNNGVSHTFTIPSLKLNVPVAPKSITTFTFHTGDAGTYVWHCMDPCGTGDTGWGGAMSAEGYMAGKLTVA